MTIATKLQTLATAKAGIKTALQNKGADLTTVPFTHYPQIIEDLSTGQEERVGKIVDYRMNQEAEGFLKCDGSLILKAAYPELGEALQRTALLDKVEDLKTTVSGITLPIAVTTSNDVAFSPDGKYLALAHPGSGLTILCVEDWSVVTGIPPAIVHSVMYAVAFSPDGKYLAGVSNWGGRIFLLRLSDWSWVQGLPAMPSASRALAFSPDGKYLAVGSETTSPFVVITLSDFSVVAGTPATPGGVYGIAYSPDGEFVAIGIAGTPNFGVYRTSDWTGVALLTGVLGSSISSVDFSPDGQYLVISQVTVPYLQVYKVSDWTRVEKTPIIGSGYGGSFSPDGEYFAMARSGESGVSFLRTSDWSVIPDTVPLGSRGTGVSFSPDGRYVAVSHAAAPYLTVIPVYEQAPNGYAYLPKLPAKQHGNVTLHPLIKAE